MTTAERGLLVESEKPTLTKPSPAVPRTAEMMTLALRNFGRVGNVELDELDAAERAGRLEHVIGVIERAFARHAHGHAVAVDIEIGERFGVELRAVVVEDFADPDEIARRAAAVTFREIDGEGFVFLLDENRLDGDREW